VSDAEIREAARKQREREQAIAARKQRDLDAQNDPRKRTRHQRTMVVDALAGKGGDRLAIVLMTVVLVVVAFGSILLFDTTWLPLIMPLPLLALMIGAYFATDHLLAMRARAELRRVRRGFEAGVYVEQLADNRHDGVVVFTLRFQPPVPPERRRDLCDAIHGWMREPLTLTWQGHQLVAKTEEQSCHLWIDGGHGNHEWSNRALHSLTAHFIRRVLPHLDNVAKLDIDIEGDKVAWNEDP
jgi:hypothetical protein